MPPGRDVIALANVMLLLPLLLSSIIAQRQQCRLRCGESQLSD